MNMLQPNILVLKQGTENRQGKEQVRLQCPSPYLPGWKGVEDGEGHTEDGGRRVGK